MAIIPTDVTALIIAGATAAGIGVKVTLDVFNKKRLDGNGKAHKNPCTDLLVLTNTFNIFKEERVKALDEMKRVNSEEHSKIFDKLDNILEIVYKK